MGILWRIQVLVASLLSAGHHERMWLSQPWHRACWQPGKRDMLPVVARNVHAGTRSNNLMLMTATTVVYGSMKGHRERRRRSRDGRVLERPRCMDLSHACWEHRWCRLHGQSRRHVGGQALLLLRLLA